MEVAFEMVENIFSYTHNFFKGYLLMDRKNLDFNPLPDKILDCSKLKGYAEDNFKVAKNDRKLSKWVENTVGKGEISPYE